MRRFERVVALPDPKDIEFPQPLQSFKPIPEPIPTGTRVNDNAAPATRAELFPFENFQGLQLCG